MLDGLCTLARAQKPVVIALSTALAFAAGCRYSGPPRPVDASDARPPDDFDVPIPPAPDVLSEARVDDGATPDALPSDAEPGDDAAGSDGGAVDAMPPDDTGPPPDRTLGPALMGSVAYADIAGVVACENLSGPGDTMVASINTAQYNGSAACGMCVRVTGPLGSVVVRVVDRCGGCATNGLVLNRPAFEAIANLATGRFTATWQPVTCRVAGPITYHLNSGSSSTYLSVQIRNSRIPVQSLDVQRAGSFTAMTRQLNDYFTYSGAGGGPFTFRVTALDGQELIDHGITLAPGTSEPGAAQFR